MVDFRSDWERPMNCSAQKDVGHEGVITGRDAFSLRSSICSRHGLIRDANPKEEDQPIMSSTTFDDEPKKA